MCRAILFSFALIISTFTIDAQSIGLQVEPSLDVVFGEYGSGINTFIWLGQKGTLIAGESPSGTQGLNSAVFGSKNSSESDYTMSWGFLNKVKGRSSTAWGQGNMTNNVAVTLWGESNSGTGSYSTSWGTFNQVSGDLSTAWGTENFATMTFATVWGNNNKALGNSSTVWGELNRAEGIQATTWGSNNIAIGNSSTVWGEGNRGKGHLSTVAGVSNRSNSYLEMCIGRFADTLNSSNLSSWVLGEQLFVVGNGSNDNNRNNAFTILKNGKVGFGVNVIAHNESVLHSNGAKLSVTGMWMNASDLNRKKDISALQYGLSTIMALNPVKYKYKIDNSPSIGFIAQEVEQLIPEVVQGEEGNKAMAYGQITAVLTKALQEQQAMILELQIKMEELLKKNELLEKRILHIDGEHN